MVRRRRRRTSPLPALIATLGTVLVIALVAAALYFAFHRANEIYYDAAYPIEYEDLVSQYCEEYQVDEALVYAVIKNESSFTPDAVSSVDARGLMQIQGPTLEWAVYREGEDAQVTADDLFDPQVNIKYGVMLLRLFLDEFEHLDVALCAYHAGWGNVKKWLDDPEYSDDGVTLKTIPFGDTSSYVQRVLQTRDKYQELYDLRQYEQ